MYWRPLHDERRGFTGNTGAVTMLDKRVLFSFLTVLFCSSLALYLYLDMRFNSVAVVVATCATALCEAASADVEAARATALTLSPVSSIKGKRFDRFVNIWFENTDFDMAAGDRTSSPLSPTHTLQLLIPGKRHSSGSRVKASHSPIIMLSPIPASQTTLLLLVGRPIGSGQIGNFISINLFQLLLISLKMQV
jgi:hypothetical protein